VAPSNNDLENHVSCFPLGLQAKVKGAGSIKNRKSIFMRYRVSRKGFKTPNRLKNIAKIHAMPI